MENVPNPGSDAALDMGCTCPVFDNAHGDERIGKLRGFWVSADCPLHARNDYGENTE